MVHHRFFKYSTSNSPLRKGPDPLTKEQAIRVVDSIIQGARAIFTRQLCLFYVESWKSYSGLSLREDPASKGKIHAVCSRIFDEVKEFVSLRAALGKRLQQ